MRSKATLALGVFAFCLTASASTIYAVDGPCMASTSSTCEAEAQFTFSNGQLQIQLTNDLADPNSVVQSLSGISFVLSNGGPGFVASSSGTERTIASNGTYANGSTVAAGWGFAEFGTGFTLDDLAYPGHDGPEHTLIGNAGSAGIYDGNHSITGNGPHNPFLAGVLTFTLDIAGVNANTQLQSVSFQFGTTDGEFQPATVCVNCGAGSQDPATPEPMTFALAGAGLVALGLLRRKRS